ncbi:DUF2971 domain-containing protein [Pseudomonas sp. BN411]|uniref:DUF2971 domain-containing protein n=1 Tax=Pseudomonas sp. BN411 TaxID=2567887 RepID=UPI0024590900|nr:DUF2971 domain-containing protein [Pseudomonas sp. BN411]
MVKAVRTPSKLYKYRTFSTQTLDLLVTDQVYFADPTKFNDPLDTRPYVRPDASAEVLQEALQQLIERRMESELKTAAEAIHYRGPKTQSRISELSRVQAQNSIRDIAYLASDPEYAGHEEEVELDMLAYRLQEELLRRYDKGILSLAGRFDCPLMWSHYGDQHNGICIGYSVPDEQAVQLHQVIYGGSRVIEASRVAAMLSGEPQAQNDVDSAVLLRKAKDWKYEKEWRVIGPKGLAENPFVLADITFGLRCSGAVKYAVMSAFQDRVDPVKFYEIREESSSFNLKRRQLTGREFENYYPKSAQRNRAIFHMLEPLVGEDEILET